MGNYSTFSCKTSHFKVNLTVKTEDFRGNSCDFTVKLTGTLCV